MDRLTNDAEIETFVNMIVDGGGKAFKPLTRQDLYELCCYCKRLKERIEPIKVANEVVEGGKPEENPNPPTPIPAPSTNSDGRVADGFAVPSDEFTNDTPQSEIPIPPPCPQTKRRWEELVNNGLDAQEAYDKFLKWAATHNRDGQAFVMDFENGKRSEAAAFAYWLLGLAGKEE